MAGRAYNSRGSRFGTRFRGKLASAYGHRGVALNGLWYVYSPKTRRDWILKSDIEWDHFVSTEANPAVVTANYAPEGQTISVRGEALTLQADAVVTFADGKVVWRKIQTENQEREVHNAAIARFERIRAAALEGSFDYELWTNSDLHRNPTGLANWRRMVVWIAASRSFDLAPYQEELARLIHAKGAITLGQIESSVGQKEFPIYAAAVFSQLFSGAYESDIDVLPLSLATTVRARGTA